MARLTWLADVLRAAGVQVVEVDGWRTRGSDSYGPIRGVVYHATADKANSGPSDARDDSGAVAVIRDGRPDLPGPIAVAYVNREGTWFLIAAGRCNTVRTGTAGPLKGIGNSNILGVEAENDNKGEIWPPAQLRSLRIGFAAILRKLGLGADRLAGHYEHQPREKSDPYGITMTTFRREVAAVMAGQPAGEEDDMSADTERRVYNTDEVMWQGLVNGSPIARYLQIPNQPTVDRPIWVVNKLTEVAADAKASRLAIEALVAVVNAGGGSVETAAVLAHMDDLAAAEKARELELLGRIADLETDLAAARAGVEAQLSPAERAGLDAAA